MLVAGGRDLNGLVSTVELYDPSTGTFSVTGGLNTPRSEHTATLLPNGEVLIAADPAANYLTSAEPYRATTGTFTFYGPCRRLANFSRQRCWIQASSWLPAARTAISFSRSFPALNCITRDRNIPTHRQLEQRAPFHTATLLNNGQILIPAGTGARNSAELYDPASGTLSITGS